MGKSKNDQKTQHISLKLSRGEKQQFEDAARECGLSLSAWIRMTLRRDLGKAT